ncbi:MAG: hypothetical protein ACC661_02235 [Verrucomicrobiales bacterium]
MSSTTKFAGEDLLSLDEALSDLPPIQEDFEEQVQHAQEQLLKLRHEQEQVEKQKAELETLSKQQERFVEGRTELTERLNQSICVLEREAFEAEKRVEQFLHNKDAFVRHLEIIESFKPEEWPREDLRAELSKALSAIEEAECDYRSAMGRMSGFFGREGDDGATASIGGGIAMRGFSSWFFAGLAFTTPLMLFGLVALFMRILLAP